MYFFDKNSAFDRNPLFTDSHHTVLYHDWYCHADALHSLLRPRSLAAVICHNTMGSALSYLTCLQNRIVPLLIDSKMDAKLMERLLGIYEPEYIFKPASAVHPLYTMEDYGVYRHSRQKHDLYPELALLLTTSGSTGSPKLVRQSYANIQSNAAAIASYLSLTSQQRPVSSLPMHYTFGLSVINSHIFCGAAEYLTEDTVFDEAFWKFCRQYRITSLAGVPFTYECLKRIGFTGMDLPDLTLLLQAGGKLSKRLQQEYGTFAAAAGKKFIIMYGQTEATARMSYLPADACLKKIGSIGIAIPGGTFHIMENEHTEITAPDTIGELCYDGTNVTLGYASGPSDLRLGDMRHGRLWTGDMAYQDADGFYYITGRKKRFVKITGSRVNLDEIEQLFKNAFAGSDFACAGKDDDIWLFTTMPAAAGPELEDFFFKKTKLHPSCLTLRAVAAIPKNSSGKTQYKKLQNFIQQGGSA